MEKQLTPKQERGKKWNKVRKLAEVNDEPKTVEWMDSQKAIVDDEKAYADFLNPPKAEKPAEEIKSKKVK